MSVFLGLACHGVGEGSGGVLDGLDICASMLGWLLRSEVIAMSVVYWVVVRLNNVGAVWCWMQWILARDTIGLIMVTDGEQTT